MSVFDDKKTKSKKSYFAATSIEDTSIDMTKIPKSIDELKKAGRGEQRQNTSAKPKGKRGRPKSEHIQEKESILVFLTKEQKAELKRRAEKADLSMTKYITIKVFGIDI